MIVLLLIVSLLVQYLPLYHSTSPHPEWNIPCGADLSLPYIRFLSVPPFLQSLPCVRVFKPASGNDCPEVDITNYTSGDADEDGVGNLAVQYEIKTKATAIKKAKMLLMKENDWDDALNEYMATGKYDQPSDAWAVCMDESKDAVDVTDAVKELGNKFNFSRTFTQGDRGWYVVVLAVTDDYGTTVTRASFHSHMDAEWTIMSRTFPVENATAFQTKKKGMPLMNGKVTIR